MDAKRREQLERAGWKVYDSPAELLGLSPEDMAEIDRMVNEARRNGSQRIPMPFVVSQEQ